MHTQGCAPPQVKSKDNAEIMSSDATPKGRVLTMRRWPFELGQCILTPRARIMRDPTMLCCDSHFVLRGFWLLRT